MRITLLLISFTWLFTFPAKTQNNDVLLVISGENITVDEFERSYRKNNNLLTAEKQTPAEYLELFINFRLKVQEAERLKLDTTTAFRDELNMYVKQLARPYLTDSSLLEEIMVRMYERMKTEVHASHILVLADQRASPRDTLDAYTRIVNLRNSVVSGEDFNKTALESSEDPSARENAGDLGWFGAFRMVYPFENTAYNLNPGEISQPVRTSYGYHIIKVHEKRPARPSLLAAHIYVRSPMDFTPKQSDSARLHAFGLYNRILKGEHFEDIAKLNSDDKSTGANGGMLPWFSSGDMIPEFFEAADSIKEIGGISPPVKTFYGWHIIKLHGRKILRSYDEERKELLRLCTANDRKDMFDNLYLEQLKNTYFFSPVPSNYKQVYSYVDSSVFEGRWNDSLMRLNNDMLFSIGDKRYPVAAFARHISSAQRAMNPYHIRVYTDDMYRDFVKTSLLDYKTLMLRSENPEFGSIVREYHDGLLLFNLSDSMVWSKAVADSTGLRKFYKKNRSAYKWKERAEVIIATSKSRDTIEMVRSLAEKYGSKKFTEALVRNSIVDSAGSSLQVKTALFEKGDNGRIDSMQWRSGTDSIFAENPVIQYIFVKKILKPAVKSLEEVKGIIISEYQAYLDEKWIESLRKKYPVAVNRELLEKIK